MTEPDWDAGSETRYEEHRARTGDLCERCRNDLAIEGDDFCRACFTDIESVLAEVEDAYELSDPKHLHHYEAMVDAWDNRDKTEAVL